MAERVCVFVDGENFRHSIGELFNDFNRADYLPKNADWGELFDWLVDEASGVGQRVRTYWYVIEYMDFFPYSYPNAEREPEKLKRVLCTDPGVRAELQPISGEDLKAKMAEVVENLKDNRIRMERRFNGWMTLQNSISARHPAIEFRRAGAIRCNLFDSSLGQEKAVDVQLATDLIMLRDIYDTAVLVSGDQDYVPAVKVAKDSGKRVINVAFKTRGGKLLPGGARRLNQITDWSLDIPYSDLRAHLNI